MSRKTSDFATLTASEHYNKHLGPIYSWMTGDFDTAVQGVTEYFSSIGLSPGETGLAVDLGTGHGVQAASLANLGFSVKAVDFCQPLLDELKTNVVGLPVEAINDSLLNFQNYIESSVDAIICIGDTLTHLESQNSVIKLIEQVSECLVKDGVFCTSFRDYTADELKGDSRFIPVRSDKNRIHTCFLEYEETTVRVSDIIHNHSSNGWDMSLSSYRKLRLSPETFTAIAQKRGLKIAHMSERRGMHYLAFKRN